jgi:hypothetical protein
MEPYSSMRLLEPQPPGRRDRLDDKNVPDVMPPLPCPQQKISKSALSSKF